MDTSVLDKVRDLAEPIIAEQALELVNVEFLQEGGRRIIRITIDRESGVTLDDCTSVSREVGNILEIRDVVPYAYSLEVSSPGLERPLKTLKDFEKFLECEVFIKTFELLNGKRNFKGTLKLIQNGIVFLEKEGSSWDIPLNTIRQAKLVYEFPAKSKRD